MFSCFRRKSDRRPLLDVTPTPDVDDSASLASLLGDLRAPPAPTLSAPSCALTNRILSDLSSHLSIDLVCRTLVPLYSSFSEGLAPGPILDILTAPTLTNHIFIILTSTRTLGIYARHPWTAAPGGSPSTFILSGARCRGGEEGGEGGEGGRSGGHSAAEVAGVTLRRGSLANISTSDTPGSFTSGSYLTRSRSGYLLEHARARHTTAQCGAQVADHADVYPSSGANKYYQRVVNGELCAGGGDGYAFRLSQDMQTVRCSKSCATFASPCLIDRPLSSAGVATDTVAGIEIWGFH